jgi:RNA polymerase sigma-70 factor (ECF subfamily)
MAGSSHRSTRIQACLDRLRAGDERARAELVEHACARFRRLAAVMLKDFARLKRWEDTDAVFQGAMLRLWQALAQVTPEDVLGFSRLAALQIRRELLDLARHYYGPQGLGANYESKLGQRSDAGEPPEAQVAAGSSLDPARLDAWTEFHRQVEQLPEPERVVVDLLWYQGLKQEEAAQLLGVSRATVKLRWQAARLALHDKLKGLMPGG